MGYGVYSAMVSYMSYVHGSVAVRLYYEVRYTHALAGRASFAACTEGDRHTAVGGESISAPAEGATPGGENMWLGGPRRLAPWLGARHGRARVRVHTQFRQG